MSSLTPEAIAARLALLKKRSETPPPPPPAAATPPVASAGVSPVRSAVESPTPSPVPDRASPVPAPMMPTFGSFTTTTVSKPSAPKKQAAKKVAVDAKVMRVGGDGKVWQDTTLSEWPDDDHRIFVGNLGDEVTKDMLTRAFSRYPSFQKAKVIRHPKTEKTRGYGFVSFGTPEDMLKALEEMERKYIGTKPITLKKGKWDDRQAADTTEAFKQFRMQSNTRNKKHHIGNRYSPY